MPEMENARLSIVEDVPVPKQLLATAKFNSPWEQVKWEKSLPQNDRTQPQYSATSKQNQSGGIVRSASLSTRRVARPRPATRPQSNPPELHSWENIRRSAFLKPPATVPENEPITPIKESFISPKSTPTNSQFNSRRSSMYEVYEKAKVRGVALHRKYWVRLLFEYSLYTLLILFVYFVLVGMPLWKGAVWWLYWVVQTKFVIQGGYAITIGLAALYAFLPLLILFEKDPPPKPEDSDFDLEKNDSNVKSTALIIPCYKSATIIGPTLKAALEIFPPKNIFVIANGNSETPLDNTEEVCRPYGVNHLWVPVGSKIVAQFAGCYAAKGFENVLLIDDDCALPPNFPIVSDRLNGKVKCVGYTIKSVGPNSSKGTFCQQAQDLEYKMSGLQRAFFGKLGSATFPHGAISIWNTEFLKQTFYEHPGFSVSEDWFFGDSCRRLGGRITMCSSVFVETETPSSVFFSGSGSRGGFGEMTIFQQRFKRWNFFFVVGMYYDLKYIMTSWKLGWWEIGAKLCVFQEVYETLIYLFAPFILPISFIVRPGFCGILLGATIGMYIVNVIIFNEIHLRLKKERISWVVLLFYYTFYKIALTVINVVSCYWSLYKYARYFAKRHPKVIEDRQAIEVILSLEQEVEHSTDENEEQLLRAQSENANAYKRLTLTRVGPDTMENWPLQSDMEQRSAHDSHSSPWI
ncbi:uncharacterized protein N7498_010743 [Penicillium cinerascens]|uniref:Uncharacterized protein n=1 Tax=Penicillium cinerascens TaxID=70096 RepID=A0A9W9J721_9EURO|nr:uncharacterized protein N7498_010743 [Penicillium cinerascens]KAJ5191758.1 hypothetical protein N7498_010743 [Penicillium cinerascens]